MINVLPDTYPEEDNIFTLINKSFRFNDDRDLPIFAEKLGALARFRNPKKTNPLTLDCVSCHIANASELYAVDRFPELERVEVKDTYTNPRPDVFNLENTTIAPKSTKILRAFGYFGDKAAINQRAINESANVAHYLNIK